MSTTSSIPPGPSHGFSSRLVQFAHDHERRRRLLAFVCLIAFGIAIGLAALARLYTVIPLDVWFTRELQEHQWALVARVMYGISIFGYEPWALITIAVGVLGVGIAIGWREGGYLLALTVVQGLVNLGIKLAIGRPRPVSGIVDVFVFSRGQHTRLHTAIAIVLGALISLVGPSRIILGSDWLSDVIAAYLLGLVILIAGVECYLAWIVRPRSVDR